MIIDLRYHIASLVAVFLALGLGILIGSAALGERVLVNQQKHLIDRLESDVTRAMGERRSLEHEVSALQTGRRNDERFARAVLPALVADRLFGKQVAIIRVNPVVDAKVVDALHSTLVKAGATVSTTTVFLQEPAAMDSEKTERRGPNPGDRRPSLKYAAGGGTPRVRA